MLTGMVDPVTTEAGLFKWKMKKLTKCTFCPQIYRYLPVRFLYFLRLQACIIWKIPL